MLNYYSLNKKKHYKIHTTAKNRPPLSPKVPISSTSPGACASISLYCNSMVKIMPLSSVGGLTCYLSVSMALILLLFPSLCPQSTQVKTLLPLLMELPRRNHECRFTVLTCPYLPLLVVGAEMTDARIHGMSVKQCNMLPLCNKIYQSCSVVS